MPRARRSICSIPKTVIWWDRSRRASPMGPQSMARPIIELPAALAGWIRDEAAPAYPNECCGLIEGLRDGSVFRAMTLYPVRNLAGERDRFDIDPRDHLAAARTA